MNNRQRIRQLLSEPGYRTKLSVFFLLGAIVIAIAIIVRPWLLFLSDVFVQFAIVFFAVVAVQLVWDFVGGDVMETRIAEVQKQVVQADHSLQERLSLVVDRFDNRFTNLERATTLLADLIDGNIGVERIWRDRKTWQADPKEGLNVWQDRLCQAGEVDILGNTLWNNWFHEGGFRHQLFANITRGARVRVLLYDPDAEILKIRAADEKDPRFQTHFQMQQEVLSTLAVLWEERRKLKEDARNNQELRLTTMYLHLAQVIRADDEMLLAIYLSGKSGSPSPTLKLRGPQSTYFVVYKEQFDILWGRARKVDDAELQKVLEKHGNIELAPFEA